MLSAEYIKHYRKTLLLAFPVCMSQLGHVMVGIVDSIMVGNYGGEGSSIGTLSLAASALANSFFSVVLVFGIGVSFGITPLVANADGEKNASKISLLLQHAILLYSLFGVGLFLLLYSCSPLLNHFGQAPEVVDLAIPYFNIVVFSMIPLMIFLAFKQFAEGLSFTKQAMYISIFANLVHIALNYILIYGKLGFEPMGLKGAGWSSFISRVIMAGMMFYYIYNSPLFSAYRSDFNIKSYSKEIMYKLFKLGIPIGLQFVFEIGAFAFAAIMIGWISAEQLAAHQIAISLAAVTYMFASGISAAATVRVGNQLGTKNIPSLRLAGFSAFYMVIVFMLVAAIGFILFNQELPFFFNKDPEVLRIASSLLIIAALFQLSDGVQVVGLGALRGISDVRVPTAITLVAYWVLGLPVGYLLGNVLKLGARGIWYGLLTGLSVSAVLLFTRFYYKSKKV